MPDTDLPDPNETGISDAERELREEIERQERENEEYRQYLEEKREEEERKLDEYNRTHQNDEKD